MNNWDEIEILLNKESIPFGDQNLIKDFLSDFSFTKRQQLMSIFLGFPEKLPLFVDLIKMKQELKKEPTKDLSDKIFETEQGEIATLIKDLS
jgi:hypothetical protein